MFDIEKAKQIVEDYERFEQYLIDIIILYKFDCEQIDVIDFEDDFILVSYGSWDSGDYYDFDTKIPVEWLNLKGEELDKAIEKQRELDNLKLMQLEEERNLKYQKEQEEQERREYERLKAKFEDAK